MDTKEVASRLTRVVVDNIEIENKDIANVISIVCDVYETVLSKIEGKKEGVHPGSGIRTGR